MIIKTEVTGKCLAALILYAHSNENMLEFPEENARQQIVRIKSINSRTDGKYTVTLEVTEWVFLDTPRPGVYRVHQKFLLAVNRILEDQIEELSPR